MGEEVKGEEGMWMVGAFVWNLSLVEWRLQQ